MKRLVAFKDLQSTEEWLKYRRLGVCGSETSIILGTNKYRSKLQLFDEKTNRIPVIEEENTYTHFGHVLEQVIRKEFTERTGLKVRQVHAIIQCTEPGYEFMLSDIDGLVYEEDGTKAIFEAKTASEYRYKEVLEGVPDEYFSQVQHYMFCLNLNKAYVCFLVGGNKYVCHIVYRDNSYIDKLLKKEKEFWDCVINDTPPEVDGLETTTTYLQDKFAEADEEIIELPDESSDLICEYFRLEEETKVVKEQKDKVANELKMLLANHEKGTTAEGHVVSWKHMIRNSIDQNKIKELLGVDAFNGCFKQTSYRRFEVA